MRSRRVLRTRYGGLMWTRTRAGVEPPPASNVNPVASFTYARDLLAVQFTDTSTDADGEVVGWAWSFGDGTTSNDRHPAKAYSATGTYSVTLTVTDNRGARSAPATLNVAVTTEPVANVPPTARINVVEDEDDGLLLHFTDRSGDTDGVVVERLWDFGDGTTTTERHPSHIYAAAGRYPVRLTATDDRGGQHSLTTTLYPEPHPAVRRYVGQAELPRVVPEYTFDLSKYTGHWWKVGNASDLHTLLSGGTLNGRQLADGDLVGLMPGVNYNSGRNQQYVRPGGDPSRPNYLGLHPDYLHNIKPPGVRVGNADDPAGVFTGDDALAMARFSQRAGGGAPPLVIQNGAKGWDIVGIAVDTGTVTTTSRLIEVGANAAHPEECPFGINFDRIHAYGRHASSLGRPMWWNARHGVVVDSHLYVEGMRGIENQAISMNHAYGEMLIDNCLLVAGGENIMTGGGRSSLRRPITDVTVRRSWLLKPYHWNPRHPTWDGRLSITGKNIFELKFGIRVHVHDCLFEHFWPSGQDYAVNIKQARNGTWSEPHTRDVVFERIWLKEVLNGFTLSPGDGSRNDYNNTGTRNIVLRDVLITGLGEPRIHNAQSGTALFPRVDGFDVERLTAPVGARSKPAVVLGTPWTGAAKRFRMRDSILGRNAYGWKGSPPDGNASLNQHVAADRVIEGNLLPGYDRSRYPAGSPDRPNLYPAASAVQFTEDWSLADTSAGKGALPGGADPGCDIPTLMSGIAGCTTGDW